MRSTHKFLGLTFTCAQRGSMPARTRDARNLARAADHRLRREPSGHSRSLARRDAATLLRVLLEARKQPVSRERTDCRQAEHRYAREHLLDGPFDPPSPAAVRDASPSARTPAITSLLRIVTRRNRSSLRIAPLAASGYPPKARVRGPSVVSIPRGPWMC
jgi:hypothetical protein